MGLKTNWTQQKEDSYIGGKYPDKSIERKKNLKKRKRENSERFDVCNYRHPGKGKKNGAD